ncbi:hypothetical protein ACFXAY_01335 [Streptomyces microflavus]|uniref:hypothetical protein n=1 Tax=Streptomyces microflavus TaxID=1919 RepID=UPI003683E8E9
MIRIEIEQDGEWVPVNGVRSVELQQSEVTPAPGDREARINAAMERLCRSMHRSIRDALRIPVEPTRRRKEQPEPWEQLREQPPMPPDIFEHIAGALCQAELPAQRPTPSRSDRPAWQPPYGPPRRR